LAAVIDWEAVSVSATKNCIVFVRKQTFLVVRPMKKELDIKFYLPTYSDEFPVYKSTAYSAKYETHIRLSAPEDIDSTVLKLIKISYDL
jgi:hypothetical protein